MRRSEDANGVTLVVGADWRSGTAYTAEVEDDTTPGPAQTINDSDTKQSGHVNSDFTR
ncbi:hypothetical protein [Streptomyces cellulosae]|uniref:Uncharacterized protein n=1 Tax=Streptomyces cellulosae TaxID=1968 RepID=A0ABW7YGF4_STRCE